MSTSTFSMSSVGMMLMSEADPLAEVGSPGPRRKPLTSTRVRLAFKPRRLTVAVPVDPFDTMLPWSANTCGSWFSTSSTRVTPVAWMSAAVTKVTGAIEVWLGTAMRDPVTTTSASGFSAPLTAVEAGASCACTAPNEAASVPPVSAARMAMRSALFPSMCSFINDSPVLVRATLSKTSPGEAWQSRTPAPVRCCETTTLSIPGRFPSLELCQPM